MWIVTQSGLVAGQKRVSCRQVFARKNLCHLRKIKFMFRAKSLYTAGGKEAEGV